MRVLYGLGFVAAVANANVIDYVRTYIFTGKCDKMARLLAKHKDTIGDWINDPQAESGQTALMAAVLNGQTECVKTLLSYPEVDETIPEKDGYTPMHGVGFQGRHDIAQLLLDDETRNIDPNDRHSDGYVPLHRACRGNEERHTLTVAALVKAGVPYDEPHTDGKVCWEMTSNPNTKEWITQWEKVLAMSKLAEEEQKNKRAKEAAETKEDAKDEL